MGEHEQRPQQQTPAVTQHDGAGDVQHGKQHLPRFPLTLLLVILPGMYMKICSLNKDSNVFF